MASRKDTTTRIQQDGLRYTSKAPGSPFSPRPGAFSGATNTMSCFFCGAHQPPNRRTMQKVLGRSQPVCEPLCEKNPRAKKLAAQAAAAAEATPADAPTTVE
jgi:hypothetical protein